MGQYSCSTSITGALCLSVSQTPVKMAALRKLAKNTILGDLRKPNPSIISATCPLLFISCRGIASKLFVGGLSFYTTEDGLSEAFSQHGQLIEAKIVMDRVSDRSKGFGFVTYASEDEAQKAIKEMSGKPLNGRAIFVDYAKPRSGSRAGMPIASGPPEENGPAVSKTMEWEIDLDEKAH